MPRGRSSPGSSSRSTSRSTAQSKIAPPQQAGQVAKSGMAGGLMGGLMSGMAFGAGAEMIRGLFRNPVTGGFMMPLILSGATTYGAHRFLLTPEPYKSLYLAGIFGATFIVTKKLMPTGSDDGEGEHYPMH